MSKKENNAGDQSNAKISPKKSKPNKLSGIETAYYKGILIIQ